MPWRVYYQVNHLISDDALDQGHGFCGCALSLARNVHHLSEIRLEINHRTEIPYLPDFRGEYGWCRHDGQWLLGVSMSELILMCGGCRPNVPLESGQLDSIGKLGLEKVFLFKVVYSSLLNVVVKCEGMRFPILYSWPDGCCSTQVPHRLTRISPSQRAELTSDAALFRRGMSLGPFKSNVETRWRLHIVAAFFIGTWPMMRRARI